MCLGFFFNLACEPMNCIDLRVLIHKMSLFIFILPLK